MHQTNAKRGKSLRREKCSNRFRKIEVKQMTTVTLKIKKKGVVYLSCLLSTFNLFIYSNQLFPAEKEIKTQLGEDGNFLFKNFFLIKILYIS